MLTFYVLYRPCLLAATKERGSTSNSTAGTSLGQTRSSKRCVCAGGEILVSLGEWELSDIHLLFMLLQYTSPAAQRYRLQLEKEVAKLKNTPKDLLTTDANSGDQSKMLGAAPVTAADSSEALEASSSAATAPLVNGGATHTSTLADEVTPESEAETEAAPTPAASAAVPAGVQMSDQVA